MKGCVIGFDGKNSPAKRASGTGRRTQNSVGWDKHVERPITSHVDSITLAVPFRLVVMAHEFTVYFNARALPFLGFHKPLEYILLGVSYVLRGGTVHKGSQPPSALEPICNPSISLGVSLLFAFISNVRIREVNRLTRKVYKKKRETKREKYRKIHRRILIVKDDRFFISIVSH